ncbi:hypothetical protein AAFF_G00369870 [Aldrovandia affinis]|uniref:Uncharacterized protein n=1 Tax=Aldrovandia affinis TaxID=143900 RepID=A0AAD7VZ78_9TELE|nr:hypothetical protein AAFF_G00369870 [Aldrovandia affinis]
MPGRHLCLDIHQPPEAEPGEDRATLPPSKGSMEGSIVCPSLSARSLGVPGQPAVLLGPHHSNHPDLPILPPQHPEDPTVPHPRGHTTPGPGPGDRTSGLVEFHAGRSTGLCHQATNWSRMLPHVWCSINPSSRMSPLSALAPHCSMH